jgi:DMSO/TMAO reductase YedYZ molybdopterin-dependent catalytic subunit
VTRAWPVLSFGPVPRWEHAEWTLTVHGEVERPFELDWAGFQACTAVEIESDFHCVTGWSRLACRWRGVRILELARRASLRHTARFARFADRIHYDTSVPLEAALAPDALLATHEGGAPLAPEHGGPVRAVVPGLYAWKSCKWVREIEFLAEDRLGFWEQRGYANGADPWREERLV